MTTALMRSTQIAAVLTLQVVAVSDTGNHSGLFSNPQVITLPLANVTPILFALWQTWQWFDRLAIATARLAARLVFTVDTWQARLAARLNPFNTFSWGVG